MNPEIRKVISGEITSIPLKAMLCEFFVLILKLIYSSTDVICYSLMVLAHSYYGNLLSIFYIVAVFGYALLIRCRPHRKFWTIMLVYSEIVVLLKFICHIIKDFYLDYLCGIQGESQCNLYKDFFDSLQRKVNC